MKSSLYLLFAGNSRNVTEAVSRILTESGFKTAAMHAGNTCEAEQLLKRNHHFQLVILLPAHSPEEHEKLVSIISRSGLPWIYVYEQADRDEIYRLLHAGCGDCIGINGLDRLEFAVYRILEESRREKLKRKQFQEDLERARQTAEAANQAKSEFLANISHEIRTPLNGVLGMINLTLNTELTEMQRDNLSIAKSCAASLLNLINDILDFSKIEARKLSLEVIGFDFTDLLERTLKPHKIKAQEKTLEFRYNIDPKIPRIIYGDPNRLQQVLNNLIGNAVKFTEKGSIDVLAALKKESKNTLVLEFQVCDTGIGIAPQHTQKIFDTFIQADSSITRRFGGSGLGLAISRRLVDMMGGSIWVESEPGMGSKFYFTVELSKTAQQEPTEPRNSCLPVHKKGLKILLAEDDKVNGIVISRILKEAGQNVTHVADGAEVIRQLEKEKYDLILMDIQMPDIDGLEAVRAIREIEKETHEHIPIIAVTAHALKGDREKYLSQGMDEYVSKPLQIDDLLNKISRLIESLAEREETDGMKIAVHTNSDEPPVCKQKSKASVLEEISGNVDLLGKALDEKNFQLVEKYAHDVKLLSEESNMTGLRSIAFRMELAARKEDFHAANRHHTDMMDILKKLKEAGNNENTDRGR